jgi:putative hemolysin
MRGHRLLSPGAIIRRFSPAIAMRPDLFLRPLGHADRAPWRAARGLPPLGRLGELEVRLAASAADVRRAQGLRYHVFYEEMTAVADFGTLQTRRDSDRFDLICDHLLVCDTANPQRSLLRSKSQIVGTYRLLRQAVADRHGGFYTAGEYDIEPLIRAKPHLDFLELGRSCVLAPYRNRRTVELLWHGIWAYVLMHRIDVMVGCASLEGTDPDRLALPLSYLHHIARAPEEWRVRAHDHLYVEMNRVPLAAIDTKAALRALPPLVRGYLRLGAFVGDGAVIDQQFGTTDVCIVLPVAGIASRYVDYYGPAASRYAVTPMPDGAPLAAA